MWALHLALLASAQLTFITLGDWGGIDVDSQHATNQRAVAKQLTTSAKALNSSWIINVGDNFYYIGVANTTDPQWKDDFENVYTDPSLAVKWYSALGNHDYGLNPECQTQYHSPVNDRWVLPARYYTQRLALSSSQFVTFVFIDSNPCISAYRSNDSSGWDPPPDEAPLFHQNILDQDCPSQYSWLKSTLAAVNPNDWLIVVGHHPADEIDVQDMASVMQSFPMDLYLCGHSHTLELFTLDKLPTPYVISGAGCMVNVPSAPTRHEIAKGQGVLGHTYQTVFNDKVAGFTTHTFNAAYTQLTTSFVSYTGQVLYSFVTNKH